MPYVNVPDELQDKMESCVLAVSEKNGGDKEAAIAICYASVVEGKSLPPEFILNMGAVTVADATKSPPEGHEFYGNQYGGGGGGGDGKDKEANVEVVGAVERLSEAIDKLNTADLVVRELNRAGIARDVVSQMEKLKSAVENGSSESIRTALVEAHSKLAEINGRDEVVAELNNSVAGRSFINAIVNAGRVINTYVDKKSLSATKVGRRNSAPDQERLQQIHDFAVENGAVCGEMAREESEPEETREHMLEMLGMIDSLINEGEPVKVLAAAPDGKTRVGGYLVRFSTASDPDISAQRDYFDKLTDFGVTFPAKSMTWFNHRMPVKTESGPRYVNRQFSPAELSVDEIGVFAVGALDERDAYEKFVADLARAGKLGWSSGTAQHLVKRSAAANGANHIDLWPLGLDASYTHAPAEPRNQVLPLKAIAASDLQPLYPSLPDGAETAGDAVHHLAANETAAQPIKANLPGGNIMADTQIDIEAAITRAAEQAVKAFVASQPVANPVGVQVTLDEGDRPFKSLAENCQAIKDAARNRGGKRDPRLDRIEAKALGAGVGIPADGGYLLEPTITAALIKPMHETGPFLPAAQKLPVSSNSNYGWINGVDETSRVAGSRWGGVQGYRVAEGGSITASKPKFRRINWELMKYAAAVYATDELLRDTTQFAAIVDTACREELAFMVNDDILNGNGAAGCTGILGTGAYVSVTAETGQKTDTIVYENLTKMWSRLSTRSKMSAAWFINTDCNPQLDALSLASGTGALEPRFIGYDQTGVLRIKGRPVIETEFNGTLGDLGDIVLADMSQYLLWERGGIEAAMSVDVAFLTDETVFRFVYSADGKPSIAAPTTPYKGSNTVSPFVVLASR